MSSSHSTSGLLKILSRVTANVGIVFFFHSFFPSFFVVSGGSKALVIIGLILAFLNWIIVPILHILSLPIKIFAWMVSFLLVNAAALWLSVWFVANLKITGISFAIGGGIIGWIVLSVILGLANWLIRVVLR